MTQSKKVIEESLIKDNLKKCVGRAKKNQEMVRAPELVTAEASLPLAPGSAGWGR